MRPYRWKFAGRVWGDSEESELISGCDRITEKKEKDFTKLCVHREDAETVRDTHVASSARPRTVFHT